MQGCERVGRSQVRILSVPSFFTDNASLIYLHKLASIQGWTWMLRGREYQVVYNIQYKLEMNLFLNK